MDDKDIRDADGNLIGTISDRTYPSEDLEPWQKWGIGIVAGIGALYGAIYGFSNAGIGGAILGIIIGPLAAGLICVILHEILPWLLIVGLLGLLFKLITMLWGVGK